MCKDTFLAHFILKSSISEILYYLDYKICKCISVSFFSKYIFIYVSPILCCVFGRFLKCGLLENGLNMKSIE